MTHRCTDFGMEEQKILGDGVVTGYGTVDGRQVFVFAQDFTVFGGSLSGAYAEKICKVMDLAMKVGAPVIGLNDSGGARIQEGVVSSPATPTSSCATCSPPASSRRSPRSWARAPAAPSTRRRSPTSSSWSSSTSYMFITGPDVIKTVTHEEVTKEDLGGAARAQRQERRGALRRARRRSSASR